MGKIILRKKTTRKVRKSKQNAHVVKDKKGRNHCSSCGAYINRWVSLILLKMKLSTLLINVC